MRQIELNSVEKKIIEAYRNGALIDLSFHNISDFEIGMIKIMRFGKIDRIVDFTKTTSKPFESSFISFEKRVNRQLSVTSFVDVNQK